MSTLRLPLHHMLWNALLFIAVQPWRYMAWLMTGKIDPKPRAPTLAEHDCSKHDEMSLNHELMSVNQDKYTRKHSYGITDLVESVVRSCCLDDQTKLTPIQQQARAIFLDSYFAYPEDITRDQLLVLMHQLDIIFFAGALTQRDTQRDTQRVVFKILAHDAWDWDQVRWRLQLPELLGYTEYNKVPLTEQATIAITRVFGGRRYSKKQMVDILAHEMVHAFLSLYWNWCPAEKEDTFQGGPNTHGPTFGKVCEAVHGTIGLWHPSLEKMGDDDEIVTPLPGLWLDTTEMCFAVIGAIQTGLRKVICWHEQKMFPRPVAEELTFVNPPSHTTQ